jgi:hypothetical protein
MIALSRQKQAGIFRDKLKRFTCEQQGLHPGLSFPNTESWKKFGNQQRQIPVACLQTLGSNGMVGGAGLEPATSSV